MVYHTSSAPVFDTQSASCTPTLSIITHQVTPVLCPWRLLPGLASTQGPHAKLLSSSPDVICAGLCLVQNQQRQQQQIAKVVACGHISTLPESCRLSKLHALLYEHGPSFVLPTCCQRLLYQNLRIFSRSSRSWACTTSRAAGGRRAT